MLNNLTSVVSSSSSSACLLSAWCAGCFRERNCLLKEAEVLHKARFNYIIQIFGVCNEPEFFCIVTEFMSNGSLDVMLHEVGWLLPTCCTCLLHHHAPLD